MYSGYQTFINACVQQDSSQPWPSHISTASLTKQFHSGEVQLSLLSLQRVLLACLKSSQSHRPMGFLLCLLLSHSFCSVLRPGSTELILKRHAKSTSRFLACVWHHPLETLPLPTVGLCPLNCVNLTTAVCNLFLGFLLCSTDL